MKQSCSILSTYTADVSGVCSALYEMGGMTVMHDASGCNSTYNTHDEPRWYDMPSMVFISALAEVDALMGDDEKAIDDISRAALELRPRFVAIAGTPIPMMMGTDFRAMARLVEERTGIPSFGFATNGMNSYDQGAGMALAAVAERFCPPELKAGKPAAGGRPAINLLGVTPLDFSIGGNAGALRKIFEEKGFRVVSCWAMGSPWEELMKAGEANVNLVVSSSGAPLAKALRKKYGVPFVTGLPVGRKASDDLFRLLEEAAADGENKMPEPPSSGEDGKLFVVGEPVQSAAIARALELDYAMEGVRLLSPQIFPDEEAVFAALSGARTVVADPLYRPALPRGCRFVPLPHEGYSGRIYRKDIPIFIGESFNDWIERELEL